MPCLSPRLSLGNQADLLSRGSALPSLPDTVSVLENRNFGGTLRALHIRKCARTRTVAWIITGIACVMAARIYSNPRYEKQF